MKIKNTLVNIVVVGGGFAGIATVKTLKKRHPRAHITLVSKNDTFQYYPALYRLVTGALPIEVSLPLKTIFPKGVEFVVGEYQKLNQAQRCIELSDGRSISYEYVVIALGSETNYFNIPGLPEHSFSFKSVTEALRLKQHLADTIAKAKPLLADGKKDEAVPLLHAVIVGGGPSGVELAGDIKEYMQYLAKRQDVDHRLVTVDIIESAPRVLAALPEDVSRVAEARLRRLGINIFTSRALQSQEMEEIALGDMDMKTATVIWTAGTRINASYNAPEFTMTEKRRVAVTDTLSLPNDNHVFIAGDGAGTAYSGLAQTAMKDGAYIGGAIADMIDGKTPAPYQPKVPGFVIPIGTNWAVFNYGTATFTGVIPWLIRNAIDFEYFVSIVSLKFVIGVFIQGRKYRRHG